MLDRTDGSDSRPPRDLAPEVEGFDLDGLCKGLLEVSGGRPAAAGGADETPVTARADGAGRGAITLIHRPDLRIVLARAAAGSRIADPSNDQDVALVGLTGEGELRAGERRERMGEGRMVAVAAGLDWELVANEELSALLVFAGHRSGGSAADGERTTGGEATEDLG